MDGTRIAASVIAALSLTGAQGLNINTRTDAFVESRDHPAIAYSKGPVHDGVAALNQKLESGSIELSADRDSGYLRSTLEALDIPVASQTLVFSQTSAQANQISPANPRAIYFSDTAAVGWVRGAEALELAVQDPQQGVVFYTLDQSTRRRPHFERQQGCLLCHLSWETQGVPGMLVLSTFQMSDDPNAYANGLFVDHRTPLSDRWGGWYVTGRVGSIQHRGNIPVIVKPEVLAQKPAPTPQLDSVSGRFDARRYPNACSDIVALLVLEHQARMTNLITWVGWEARVAPRAASDAGRLTPRVETAVRDLVDYMLFVDEAPLPAGVKGSCGFADEFMSRGARDRKGRSLHQLDLGNRLMRYPCSYMIDSPAFDALPRAAKEAVYRRMWVILSGEERGALYTRLARGADVPLTVEI
jgi:hypothetical protein